MTEILSLMAEYGPLVVLVAIFVWRDTKREDRMTKVIEAKDGQITAQSEQVAAMLKLVTEIATRSEDALRENTAAFNKHAHVSDALLSYLRRNGDTGAHDTLERTGS